MVDSSKLAIYRKQRDYTQQEAAADLGVSHQAWSKYERSERIPRRAIMARIIAWAGGAITEADFYIAPAPVSRETPAARSAAARKAARSRKRMVATREAAP